jgi:hypothetical protein
MGDFVNSLSRLGFPAMSAYEVARKLQEASGKGPLDFKIRFLGKKPCNCIFQVI